MLKLHARSQYGELLSRISPYLVSGSYVLMIPSVHLLWKIRIIYILSKLKHTIMTFGVYMANVPMHYSWNSKASSNCECFVMVCIPFWINIWNILEEEKTICILISNTIIKWHSLYGHTLQIHSNNFSKFRFPPYAIKNKLNQDVYFTQ